MAVDLNQMQYYVQVYDDRSISKAAKNLYVSQQYVSRIIQKFESELEVTLFLRTPKGLVPTKEGDETYECFQSILNSYHDLKSHFRMTAQEKISGQIRIVLDIGMVSLLSPKPFLSFMDKYPNISLDLEEHRIYNCKKRISEDNAELGLSVNVGWPEPFPCTKLLPLNMVVLMNEDHPLSGRKLLNVRDLIDQPLIFSGCPSYYTILQEFDRIGKQAKIPVAINELQSVYNYVKKGTGISPYVLNPKQEQPVYPKGIKAVPYDTLESLYVYCYWNKKTAGRELIALCSRHLKDQLQ